MNTTFLRHLPRYLIATPMIQPTGPIQTNSFLPGFHRSAVAMSPSAFKPSKPAASWSKNSPVALPKSWRRINTNLSLAISAARAFPPPEGWARVQKPASETPKIETG